MQLRTLVRFDGEYLAQLLTAVLRERALLALFALDGLLIALHVSVTGLTPTHELAEWTKWVRMGVDRGLPEIVEYLKSGTAAALVFAVGVRRSPALLAMSLLILCLVLDNALRIHETLGSELVPAHRNLGELAAFCVLAAVMAVVALATYTRADRAGRAEVIAITLGILLVGVFAVVVDAVRALFDEGSILLIRAMLVIEDGGELAAQSVLLVIALILWKSDGSRLASAVLQEPKVADLT